MRHIFLKKRVEIRLRKAELWELEGFRTDPNEADDILGEMGVVFMVCGHYFSRTGFRGTIDFQITQKKQNFIKCPYLKPDNTLCDQPFITDDCKLIAGYTESEWRPIS